jgi:hypothetical protein
LGENPANDESEQSKALYFQSGPSGTGKTELPIEWTNQHGCGQLSLTDGQAVDCQIVLQYNCKEAGASTMRNGISTNTADYTEPRNGESYRNVVERKRRDLNDR